MGKVGPPPLFISGNKQVSGFIWEVHVFVCPNCLITRNLAPTLV